MIEFVCLFSELSIIIVLNLEMSRLKLKLSMDQTMKEAFLDQAIANPKSVFSFSTIRFSILTSRLIRIEYNPAGLFEDRPSQQFWYRNQPTPFMNAVTSKDSLHLETENLVLDYQFSPSGLTAENLIIHVKGSNTEFHYGDPNPGILPGTTRTLDETKGPIRLQPGFLSRSGWVLLDDTKSLLFNSSGWIEPRMKNKGYRDLYFLASGFDYKSAMQDYQRIAGNVPLIPRFMLGNWWSRFWEYSQADVKELVLKFRSFQIPLSVFVLDMDWHITETGNDCTGWTGFSWNHTLFPDPKELLEWLHEQGLAVTLNLHPAEGIFPHEDRYAAAAEALGLDPSLQTPIKFDITDVKFASVYFNELLHPLEEGVDFWWLDWQQGSASEIPILDPLWWLNHLHFFDAGRDGKKRPVIFSRWGGVGNHRYPIGFSGDTIISWEALAFQPYFTATSANAAYGWWSHDIGGHMRGMEDPELYIRWLQFGVVSPILRIHCSKDIFTDHQPWAFGAEVLRISKDLMQFRHALIPYLYSMAKRNEQDGLPICTPLYYDWADEGNAYFVTNQYMFGSEIMAAPIMAPMETDLGLSRQSIWFPPGDWFNFFSGEHIIGPKWEIQYKALEEITMFAKAGAIIPLQPIKGWGGIENPNEIDLLIFPGGDGKFDLYEDDGFSTNYKNGHFCYTRYHSHSTEDSLSITVEPAAGDVDLIPETRTYTFLLRGIASSSQHTLMIDGEPQFMVGRYDEATFTYQVGPVSLENQQRLTLTVTAHPSLLAPARPVEGVLLRLLKAAKMETMSKRKIFSEWQKLAENISGIKKLNLVLTENQLISILETITGAGSSIFTDPQGRRFLILSNPKDLSGFQYQLCDSRSVKTVPPEGSIIPISSSKEWKLGANYFGVITKEFY